MPRIHHVRRALSSFSEKSMLPALISAGDKSSKPLTFLPLSACAARLMFALFVAGLGTVPASTASALPPQANSTQHAPPAQSGAKPARKPVRRRSTANRPHTDSTRTPPAKPRVEWPVKGPAPLPGSVLPDKRIVAYYGNPLSHRMGILGEVPPDEMLRRLDREVGAWTKADSTHPVIPALHLIATVAQGSAGSDGMWRARMADTLIETVYQWAQRRNALLFLDIQVAKSTLQAELPRLEKFLSRPSVHLGIDPEFSMKTGHAPGKKIGTYDARDVNYAVDFLIGLVDKYKLPPKVLVVHRFTRPMLTNAKQIRVDPRVQIVINMDGWGPPSLKKGSYDSYVYSEPVQFTGFKLFYKNDTKAGHPLMSPNDVLALYPRPLYIQYQ